MDDLRVTDPTIYLTVPFWIEREPPYDPESGEGSSASQTGVTGIYQLAAKALESLVPGWREYPASEYKVCMLEPETHVRHDVILLSASFYLVGRGESCKEGLQKPVDVGVEEISSIARAAVEWIGGILDGVLRGRHSLAGSYPSICLGPQGCYILYPLRMLGALFYLTFRSIKPREEEAYLEALLEKLVKVLERPDPQPGNAPTGPRRGGGVYWRVSGGWNHRYSRGDSGENYVLRYFQYMELMVDGNGKLVLWAPLVATVARGERSLYRGLEEFLVSAGKLSYIRSVVSPVELPGKSTQVVWRPYEDISLLELESMTGFPEEVADRLYGSRPRYIEGFKGVLGKYSVITSLGDTGNRIAIFPTLEDFVDFLTGIAKDYINMMRDMISRGHERRPGLNISGDIVEDILVNSEGLRATLSLVRTLVVKLEVTAERNVHNLKVSMRRLGIGESSELGEHLLNVRGLVAGELKRIASIIDENREALSSVSQVMEDYERRIASQLDKQVNFWILILTTLIVYGIISDALEKYTSASPITALLLTIAIMGLILAVVKEAVRREMKRIFKI